MGKVVVAAAAVVIAGSALAQEVEWTPAYLGCTFTQTVFSSHSELPWMAGKDEVLKPGSEAFEMAFAAIDLVGGRAQLIGNQGTATVVAGRGAFDSMVFLEWMPLGNANLTTVFAPGKDGIIRAVTSRHIADPLQAGGYTATQMLGTCKDHLGKAP
ncbi:hypothetical protein [Mesorhizobium sp. M1E.F.Ca.ET.063.01.1.1]|uniref:hypothetical protein n=1 Tax=Mesorhizobium sp. M1E.F.Ca.ET.063.01.1.1 TaxID=2496750 RepID=UPI000FCC2767|nr:hypothetical protein [Mesorhizobium sp. M1E.F.Ca.ET.063.01.1.1]RUW84124.1 hypothetical protein EOA29_10595 [Mesorhizobium sp. M1E.F.Ca.ET.063.01.1.1]